MLVSTLVAMTVALASAPARADAWDGSLTIASDKVFRGVSRGSGEAAWLLDLSRSTDAGWAAAIGLSQPGVYRDDGGEWSLALSKGWQLAPDWTLQLGAVHYAFPSGLLGHSYDYDELGATVGWQGRVLVSLSVSPDTSGPGAAGTWHTGRAAAGELSMHQRLAGRLALDAGVGYYDLNAIAGAGYAYGSVGLSWGIGPVQGYLTWTGSQAGARGLAAPGTAGGRRVASLSWSF